MNLDNHQYSLPQRDGEKSSISMPRRVSYEDETETFEAKASSFKNAEFDDFIAVDPAPQDANKRQLKNVVFNESVTVYPIFWMSSNMSITEKTELHYNDGDFKRFKMEVRQMRDLVVSRARQASASNPNATKAQHATVIVLSNPDLRNLGRYLCPSQITNKSTVMATMKTYRQYLFISPLPLQLKNECLADGYSKLCQWSRNHALETASVDFMQVYGHQGVHASSTATFNTTAGKEWKRHQFLPPYDQAAVQTSIKDKLLAAIGVQSSSTTSLEVAVKPEQSQTQNLPVQLFPKLTRKRKRS